MLAGRFGAIKSQDDTTTGDDNGDEEGGEEGEEGDADELGIPRKRSRSKKSGKRYGQLPAGDADDASDEALGTASGLRSGSSSTKKKRRKRKRKQQDLPRSTLRYGKSRTSRSSLSQVASAGGEDREEDGEGGDPDGDDEGPALHAARSKRVLKGRATSRFGRAAGDVLSSSEDGTSGGRKKRKQWRSRHLDSSSGSGIGAGAEGEGGKEEGDEDIDPPYLRGTQRASATAGSYARSWSYAGKRLDSKVEGEGGEEGRGAASSRPKRPLSAAFFGSGDAGEDSLGIHGGAGAGAELGA